MLMEVHSVFGLTKNAPTYHISNRDCQDIVSTYRELRAYLEKLMILFPEDAASLATNFNTHLHFRLLVLLLVYVYMLDSGARKEKRMVKNYPNLQRVIFSFSMPLGTMRRNVSSSKCCTLHPNLIVSVSFSFKKS